MISKKYFGVIMNAWLSLFNGFVVSTTMMYVKTGTLIPIGLLISTIEAFVVSFISGLLIPAAPFGSKLAETKFHASPNSLLHNIISNIPICLMMATILSLFFAFVNVGFHAAVVIAWLSSIPLAFVASYITSVILTPLVTKLAIGMTRE